jgi:hypothetical protein
MLPIAFIYPWPTNPVFYYAVAATVPIVTFTDSIQFQANRKFRAGVVSRLLPISIFIIFVGWLLLEPSQIYDYIDNPTIGTVIIISLCAIVFFASRLRHCEVSKTAFLYILPVILFNGVVTMLNKISMDHAALHQGVLFYILLQGSGTAALALGRDMFKKRSLKKLFHKKLIVAGIFIGCFIMMGTAFKGYGLRAVDNPAYFAAVGMLSPFWIICIYKIIGKKEQNIDVRSGVFLVLSVIALVLLKGML